MEITKWYTKEECLAALEEYPKRFAAKNLDGKADAMLYFKALTGSVYASKDSDDDDKHELWENLADNIEEYVSIVYFIEIRDGGPKVIIYIGEDDQKVGEYGGDYNKEEAEKLVPGKNYVQMDWIPACQLKIMKGNPNTDAEFFSGDLKVKGSLKLASMPRSLGYDFFEFLGLEAE